MTPSRSAVPVARPLAPLAAVLVVAVTVYAGMVGCGGSNQSSENTTTTTSSTTPPPENTMSAADTGGTGAMTGDVAAGEKIYKQRCVLCHGPEGKGDGPGAAALNPKPRNHTDGSYMKTQTDEQLLHSIREGKGQMPAWGKILSEQEMHSVLAYVRSLAK